MVSHPLLAWIKNDQEILLTLLSATEITKKTPTLRMSLNPQHATFTVFLPGLEQTRQLLQKFYQLKTKPKLKYNLG